jgi:hypothetical protein
MNAKFFMTAIAAAAMALAAGTVAAQEKMDPPVKKTVVTPAEKASASAKRKADVAEARKKGELSNKGDAAPDAAAKASGTKESRAAERKAARAATADADKKSPPKGGEGAQPK